MKHWWIGLAVIALAACGRGEDPASGTAPAAAPQAPALPEGPAAGLEAPPTLDDVIEHTPRYIVGISYPEEAKGYPGLAGALHDYAQAAREELIAAAQQAGDAPGAGAYDLSLEFRMLAETPRLVAVAADGSSYTGGAHGSPLVARFVWLPEQSALLRAEDLIPDEAGWREVSAYVRDRLYAALSQRIDADVLEPEDRQELMRSAGRMIDEGATPEPDRFDLFEPVLRDGGPIEALRFVFPPYQVGPYAEGTQYVVVPGAVLLPHVAERYRDLFAAPRPQLPAPVLEDVPAG
ncbi:DUF3298 and DUF4163 domain-containing protein [Luteimonas abyssi]|uniref:DUF3298 and DUF4163 domain-containing protein n=1 Tax=Luteimonas abyssi TaxID=1247514 RepID=UPI000737AE1E|nr:DUF3298 and DUF4163 domain-containing protein [Luteimonas abyssi]